MWKQGRRQYAHILLAGLVGSVALVLLTVEDINSLEERDLAVPYGSHQIAMLQLKSADEHSLALHTGLSGAISALKGAESNSNARLTSLAHSSW